MGDRPGEPRRVLERDDPSRLDGTPADASAFLLSLVKSGGAQLWQPGPGFTDRLLALAVDRHIQGPRIFDLQIALTAVENGAREIWTHDRNFLSLPGLRVRDPFA
jgi:hypothetical protein